MDSIIQRLYEDHVTGKLTEERFTKLSRGYEQEQADLKSSVESLRELVSTMETEEVNIQSFLKIVRKYTEPTELTPLLLHEFVEKIVVHAPDRSNGRRVQQIDVHYNFIGEIDLSPEYIKTNTYPASCTHSLVVTNHSSRGSPESRKAMPMAASFS